MDKSQHIEQQVEKTLSSLDTIKRAEANPFLYTRIMARLRRGEDNGWGRIGRLLTQPAFAFTALLLVILMNSIVFFQQPESPAISDDDQIFATEYNSLTQPDDEGLLSYNDDQP